MKHDLHGDEILVQGWYDSFPSEPEAAGHLASASRKQREMDAGAWLTLFFPFSPESQAMG